MKNLVLTLSAMLVVSLVNAAEPAARTAMTKAQQTLQKFDANGNGKLEGAELQAARAAAKAQRDEARQTKSTDANAQANREALLRQFDANRNGEFDAAEMTEIQRVWSGQGGRATKGGAARAGGSKDASLLKMFDRNRNGRLEPTEIRAMREQMAKRSSGEMKAPPPPRK